MSLWGNLDNATGNQKPIFSNTSTTYGVSVTETANTLVDGKKVTHSGWVKQTLGTGSILSIEISGSGQAASNGYVIFTGGGGTGANASYTVSDVEGNNYATSVTLISGGSGYSSAPAASIANSATTFNVTVGGRSGRRFYETLVATGSITGDDSNDDTYFPGT